MVARTNSPNDGHIHDWLPLISVDNNGIPPYGSLGSQIGYSCTKCGKQQILWPNMAAVEGVSESELVRMNEWTSQTNPGGTDPMDRPLMPSAQATGAVIGKLLRWLKGGTGWWSRLR